MSRPPVVVVGAGHNGLIAACYLALAGREVVVLEALDEPGGGSRSEERVPGFRFDLHSVAHNILNMTSIADELELPALGLSYVEMDPFSIAVHADGRRVRFWRSIDATLDSIDEAAGPAEAEAYRRFMDVAVPFVQALVPAIRGDVSARELPHRVRAALRFVGRQPLARGRDLLAPYESLLTRHLASDVTRGPVAAFAAHASVGPAAQGGAVFALWQAAYHLFGQWHPVGGAQALPDALVRRARSLGVDIRCGARVERVDGRGGVVRGVELRGGERVAASAVVTAIDPRTALLDLLDPPLAGSEAADLRAARRSNVVQAVVHVASDALPPYPGARPGDWNGLQSYVDRVGDLREAWVQAEAGLMPDALPLYAFTTSAIDATVAPPGGHTVYLACPAAPAVVAGGWDAHRDELCERALAIVEERAPGFRAGVRDAVAWTPDDMAGDGTWPGAHPMHLDITLDQLGPLRPTAGLADHRTPVDGLYVSGAGTSPTGGIAGTPGKRAAMALLADHP